MGEATTGGGRVSRLLSRALLVVGGAVATTAAAWAISSASASADPLADPGLAAPQPPGASTVGQLTGPLVNTVTQPITQPVAPAAQPVPIAALPASAVRSASGLSGLAGSISPVADRLRATVTGFGVLATNPLLTPGRPAPSSHSGGSRRAAPAGSFRPAAGPVPVARFTGPTRAATGPVAPSGGSFGVAPSVAGHGLPALPGGQQCGSGGVPAGTGGAGSGGSAGPGGSAIGAQFGQPGLPGLLPLGPLAGGNHFPAVAPGRQPGVTPD